MNGMIKGLLAILTILLSIGSVAAADLSNLYNGNDENINNEADVYQQLETEHKAQRLVELMKVGSDLYAVDACNSFIIDCIEKNLIVWSDIGIADGREYLILASDCRRLSIENAQQSLNNGEISQTKEMMCYESISAWEDEDLDPQTRAKNLFQVMLKGPDYYTIVGYDQFIMNSVEEGTVSWSDLGLRDEIDYRLVVSNCKRQSALNAWESLKSGNIGAVEARACRESIFAAIENGDLKEGDDIGWCTAGEVADRIISNEE